MKNNLPKDKNLVTISKAADILGVSIDTIRRWEKAGTIVCVRPNGKDRLFSVEELEKHKTSRPLSISQASEQLGISTTTLRRLEEKGLIVPQRNANGERVYSRDSLREFLDSAYFSKKKVLQAKVAENFKPLEEEISQMATKVIDEAQKVEERIESLVREATSLPDDSEDVYIEEELGPLQRLPEIAFASFVFGLLFIFAFQGITNAKNAENASVLGANAAPVEAKTASSLPSPTPTVSLTPAVTLTPTPTPEQEASSSATLVLTVKIPETSINNIADIRDGPSDNSNKIGSARNGDKFEFISFTAGWYKVKVTKNTAGFIYFEYINKEVSQ